MEEYQLQFLKLVKSKEIQIKIIKDVLKSALSKSARAFRNLNFFFKLKLWGNPYGAPFQNLYVQKTELGKLTKGKEKQGKLQDPVQPLNNCWSKNFPNSIKMSGDLLFIELQGLETLTHKKSS